MDSDSISSLFATLDRELWILTASAGTRRGGLIATFVNQASIVAELPRVVVGLAKQHCTCELVETSGAFALHLIGAEHLDWVWRFGTQSGRDIDKLEGLAVRSGATGSPLLTEALGWLDCRVEAKLDTGDRTLYLGEVVDGGMNRALAPLTVKCLLQLAPADKLGVLKEQLHQDAAVDAAAIRTWREARSERRG